MSEPDSPTKRRPRPSPLRMTIPMDQDDDEDEDSLPTPKASQQSFQFPPPIASTSTDPPVTIKTEPDTTSATAALAAALPSVSFTGPSAPHTSKTAAAKAALKKYPRKLERPKEVPFTEGALASIDARLSGVPIDLAQSILREQQDKYWKTVKECKVVNRHKDPMRGTLVAVDMQMLDPTAEPPSHAFQIINKKLLQLPQQKWPVNQSATTIAVHHLFLASRCAKMFSLPASIATKPNATGIVTLGVVVVPVTHVQAFILLVQYIYQSNVATVLGALLPQPARAALSDIRAKTARSFGKQPETAKPSSVRFAIPALGKAAAKEGARGILTHVELLHGLRSAAISLGVYDPPLWAVMDVAWDILTGAIAQMIIEETSPAGQEKLKQQKEKAKAAKEAKAKAKAQSQTGVKTELPDEPRKIAGSASRRTSVASSTSSSSESASGSSSRRTSVSSASSSASSSSEDASSSRSQSPTKEPPNPAVPRPVKVRPRSSRPKTVSAEAVAAKVAAAAAALRARTPTPSGATALPPLHITVDPLTAASLLPPNVLQPSLTPGSIEPSEQTPGSSSRAPSA